jgi:MFS family permease
MSREAPEVSPWKVLFYTCAAVFIVTLDATILFVAFPAIRASYPQVSPANLSWILNAYTIVVGAMLVPAGAYADRFGRKKVFLIGVPVFTAGSLLCGISQGVWFLIAARALQGLGAALLTPTSLSLVLGEFPKEKRAMAVAVWGSVAALASAVGPALGSVIIQSLTWRWVFFVNIPIGVWCWVQGRRVLHEPKLDSNAPVPRLVAVGQIAMAVALVSLAIVQGKTWGWGQSENAFRWGCWIGALPLVREHGFPKPRTTCGLVVVSIEELSVLQWRNLCFQCGIFRDVPGERPLP